MAFVEVGTGIIYKNVSKEGSVQPGEVFIGHLVEVKEREFPNQKTGKMETAYTFILLQDDDSKIGISGGGPLAYRLGYKADKEGNRQPKVELGALVRLEYEGKKKMSGNNGHAWKTFVDDSNGAESAESDALASEEAEAAPESKPAEATKPPKSKKGAAAAAEVFGGEEIPF